MRQDILLHKEQILKWIQENRPKSFISQELHCKPETLNKYLNEMGIEYKGNKGSKGISPSNYKTAAEYIKSTTVKSHILKEKLFKEGIKERKCEHCGLAEWMGEPIKLELHHKDNNHYNNEFSNLQILCPTCHAMLGNANTKIEIAQKVKIKTNTCVSCGALISDNATRCAKCVQIANRVCERPDRNTFKELIYTMPFVQIGKMYNVSDKAIAKWCIAYDLPSRKTDIKKYSKEEWELL